MTHTIICIIRCCLLLLLYVHIHTNFVKLVNNFSNGKVLKYIMCFLKVPNVNDHKKSTIHLRCSQSKPFYKFFHNIKQFSLISTLIERQLSTKRKFEH